MDLLKNHLIPTPKKRPSSIMAESWWPGGGKQFWYPSYSIICLYCEFGKITGLS